MTLVLMLQYLVIHRLMHQLHQQQQVLVLQVLQLIGVR